jgi:hypothetical protein
VNEQSAALRWAGGRPRLSADGASELAWSKVKPVDRERILAALESRACPCDLCGYLRRTD